MHYTSLMFQHWNRKQLMHVPNALGVNNRHRLRSFYKLYLRNSVIICLVNVQAVIYWLMLLVLTNHSSYLAEYYLTVFKLCDKNTSVLNKDKSIATEWQFELLISIYRRYLDYFLFCCCFYDFETCCWPSFITAIILVYTANQSGLR